MHFYSAINNFTYEFDGRNKNTEQVAVIDIIYIVKLDIKHDFQDVISPWAVGLIH
jgi:hypothetical protein